MEAAPAAEEQGEITEALSQDAAPAVRSEPGEVLSPEKPEAAPAPPVDATPAAEEKCKTPEALSHDAADPEALSHDADVTEKVGQAMADMETIAVGFEPYLRPARGGGRCSCRGRVQSPRGGGAHWGWARRVQDVELVKKQDCNISFNNVFSHDFGRVLGEAPGTQRAALTSIGGHAIS